jgi:hypothetical protein
MLSVIIDPEAMGGTAMFEDEVETIRRPPKKFCAHKRRLFFPFSKLAQGGAGVGRGSVLMGPLAADGKSVYLSPRTLRVGVIREAHRGKVLVVMVRLLRSLCRGAVP